MSEWELGCESTEDCKSDKFYLGDEGHVVCVVCNKRQPWYFSTDRPDADFLNMEDGIGDPI